MLKLLEKFCIHGSDDDAASDEEFEDVEDEEDGDDEEIGENQTDQEQPNGTAIDLDE